MFTYRSASLLCALLLLLSGCGENAPVAPEHSSLPSDSGTIGHPKTPSWIDRIEGLTGFTVAVTDIHAQTSTTTTIYSYDYQIGAETSTSSVGSGDRRITFTDTLLADGPYTLSSSCSETVRSDTLELCCERDVYDVSGITAVRASMTRCLRASIDTIAGRFRWLTYQYSDHVRESAMDLSGEEAHGEIRTITLTDLPYQLLPDGSISCTLYPDGFAEHLGKYYGHWTGASYYPRHSYMALTNTMESSTTSLVTPQEPDALITITLR